ncbi:MAG TPA: hypothetical protein VF252_01400 [Gemmatimonadales bacterium]
MYRIELSPGEETAFRTIEELAVAIRRGVVTSKARIWHNATSKWLPIQFHPHYKTAAAMPLTQADLVAGPPVAPLSSLNLPDPNSPAPRVTGFRPIDPVPAPSKPSSPYHQPKPHLPPAPAAGLPLIEPLGSVSVPASAKPEPLPPALQPDRAFALPSRPLPPRPAPMMKRPARAEEPSRKPKKKTRRKSGRRALRAALVGALLIGGGHLAVSAGTVLRTDGLRTYRRLVAAPPEAVQWDSPRTVAAVIPGLRNSSVPGGNKSPRGSHPSVRTLKPGAVSQASLPAMIAAPIDTVPEIQAAPSVEMPAPIPTTADSLSSTKPDSTGKKVLKGILKAVSGTAPKDQRPRR